MKRIYIAVLNDLVTDNRVHKVASTLLESGAQVTVVGIRKKSEIYADKQAYQTKRFRLFFNQGPGFYLEYNIRIFFYLLFRKFNLVVANDLDTLLGTYLVSKLRFKKIVYDSHEYFTELPELVNRNFPRSVWKIVERIILPRLKYSYTVSESISSTYKKKYNIEMNVIRNVPFKYPVDSVKNKLGVHTKQLLYQGSLNIGRGLEQLIDAMEYLENVNLQIVGDGDIRKSIEQRIKNKGLSKKITLLGRVPFHELPPITKKADLGLALEENIGLNYYYALPNKLFDYIQARIPVLVSPFPEMQKIVNKYEIGTVYDHKTPQALAEKITEIFSLENRYQKWKENTNIAANELCWEIEKNKLIKLYKQTGLVF